MKIGPKFKIARRLKAPVFEKTQTQQYAISESRTGFGQRRGRPKQQSDYGLQLIEKQKARYFYCLSEKQFAGAVKKAQSSQRQDPAEILYGILESRLDSVLLRANIGHTRLLCRQMISHGHIMVNDRKVTIPSFQVKAGQAISIRPQSLEKDLFVNLDERLKDAQPPTWIKTDIKQQTIQLTGQPQKKEVDLLFDLPAVLEFYSR